MEGGVSRWGGVGGAEWSADVMFRLYLSLQLDDARLECLTVLQLLLLLFDSLQAPCVHGATKTQQLRLHHLHMSEGSNRFI